MEMVNIIIDGLYYKILEPVFVFIVNVLNSIFIQPLVALHCPLGLHVSLLAALTAGLAFYLRRVLRSEERVRTFNEAFAKKRNRQKKLQFVSEKYSREALYKVTDDELNSDFNTYIAAHYARYALTYLLPVFLVMAWLNSVFSHEMLIERFGTSFVYIAPENSWGIQGLSVTGIFLLAYVFSLLAGFLLRRKFKLKAEVPSELNIIK